MQDSAAFLDQISIKSEEGADHEALQDINWLLQIDPHNVQALAQRGLLQAKSHNYQAALTDMALAMQLSPDDPNLRLQRGRIRLLVGDALGAIADFSVLLDQRWGNISEIYCLRGQGYDVRILQTEVELYMR